MWHFYSCKHEERWNTLFILSISFKSQRGSNLKTDKITAHVRQKMWNLTRWQLKWIPNIKIKRNQHTHTHTEIHTWIKNECKHIENKCYSYNNSYRHFFWYHWWRSRRSLRIIFFSVALFIWAATILSKAQKSHRMINIRLIYNRPKSGCNKK